MAPPSPRSPTTEQAFRRFQLSEDTPTPSSAGSSNNSASHSRPLGNAKRVRGSNDPPPGNIQPSSTRLLGKARRVSGFDDPPPGNSHSASPSGLTNAPSGEGTFHQTTDTEGYVLKKRIIKIGMNCPCSIACTGLVQISSRGRLNRNLNYKPEFPHCGDVPEQGYWNSATDFIRHVTKNKRCLAIQHPDRQQTTPKKAFGESTKHYINTPSFRVMVDGKEKYKCPKCQRKYKYSDRWEHSYHCFQENDVDISA